WIYGKSIENSDVLSLKPPRFETQVLRRYGWMLPDTFAVFLGHGGHQALEQVVHTRLERASEQIAKKGGAAAFLRQALSGFESEKVGVSLLEEYEKRLKKVLEKVERRTGKASAVNIKASTTQERQVHLSQEKMKEKLEHQLLREAARRSLVNDFFLGYFQRTESGTEKSQYSVKQERDANFGWSPHSDAYWLRLLAPASVSEGYGKQQERLMYELPKLVKSPDERLMSPGTSKRSQKHDLSEVKRPASRTSAFAAPAPLDTTNTAATSSSTSTSQEQDTSYDEDVKSMLAMLEFADVGRQLWGGSTEGLSPEALEASVLSVSFRAQASMVHNAMLVLCLNNHAMLEFDPLRVAKLAQQVAFLVNGTAASTTAAGGSENTKQQEPTPDSDSEVLRPPPELVGDVSETLDPELFRHLRRFDTSEESRKFVTSHFEGIQTDLQRSREAVCHATASVMEETKVTAQFLRFLFEQETRDQLPRRFVREHGAEVFFGKKFETATDHDRVAVFRDDLMKVDLYFAEGILLQ
ncbi:unnamed protein product, partial [Amoebophrya sp. A120]